MRTISLALILSAAASAQPHSALIRDPGRIDVKSTLRADPPSFPLLMRFNVLIPRATTNQNGPTFFSRTLLDNLNHAYFGYELFLEPRQPGTYLATFGKLGVTPLNLAGNGNLQRSINADGSANLDWTLLPLPEIPNPRLIQDGDSLSIVLFIDPSTGGKLIDDISISPPLRVSRFQQVTISAPPAPTVSGPARDFSTADAELQIGAPRAVTLNGLHLGSIALRNVRGPLVWLYLPDLGRYVFSLTPRPGLDFKKAGEVRGGIISFTIDGDSITLECNTAIAPGDSAYHLYVLRDKDWEPISESQKLQPGIGSVSQAELTALKKNQ
jgi:hypothetical protein